MWFWTNLLMDQSERVPRVGPRFPEILLYALFSPVSSRVLSYWTSFRVTARGHNVWRQVHPWMPVHHRPLYEHLRVQYLAQGYLWSALKVLWPLTVLPEHFPCFVCWGWKKKPFQWHSEWWCRRIFPYPLNNCWKDATGWGEEALASQSSIVSNESKENQQKHLCSSFESKNLTRNC